MVKIKYILNSDTIIDRLREEYDALKVPYIFEGITATQAHTIDECDALLIEESLIPSTEWLESIAGTLDPEKIVVITENLNSVTAKQFLFRGVKTFFVDSPIYLLVRKIKEEKVEETAETILRDNIFETGVKFVAITSPSGGVGKTTLSLLLAGALSKKSKRVLLIDMSPYSDLAAKLKIKHENNLYHVFSIIMQGVYDDEKLVEDLRENVTTVHDRSFMFDVLYGLDAIQAESIDYNTIDRLIKLTKLANYDFVIFDTPSVLNESVLTLFEYMNFIVFMAHSELGSGWKLIQERELIASLQLNAATGLVVNRYTLRSSFSCKMLEKELQIPLFGVIPEAGDMAALINSGKFMTLLDDPTVIKFVNYIANKMAPIFNKDEIKLRKIKR